MTKPETKQGVAPEDIGKLKIALSQVFRHADKELEGEDLTTFHSRLADLLESFDILGSEVTEEVIANRYVTKGIVDVLLRAGNRQCDHQMLEGCLSGRETIKHPNIRALMTKISFLTALDNDKENVGVIVWVGKEEFQKVTAYKGE